MQVYRGLPPRTPHAIFPRLQYSSVKLIFLKHSLVLCCRNFLFAVGLRRGGHHCCIVFEGATSSAMAGKIAFRKKNFIGFTKTCNQNNLCIYRCFLYLWKMTFSSCNPRNFVPLQLLGWRFSIKCSLSRKIFQEIWASQLFWGSTTVLFFSS